MREKYETEYFCRLFNILFDEILHWKWLKGMQTKAAKGGLQKAYERKQILFAVQSIANSHETSSEVAHFNNNRTFPFHDFLYHRLPFSL